MTAALSLYGRLGQDPRAITTRNGKAMASASLAVEIPTRGEDTPTEWFGLVAFGELAERLLKHQQGEMVSASGSLQLNTWADKDGNERSQWQVVVDTLVSARTVRPGGRKKRAEDERAPSPSARVPAGELDDLNDEIPF